MDIDNITDIETLRTLAKQNRVRMKKILMQQMEQIMFLKRDIGI